MPEFKFQQFSLSDDLCGMKIGTDGILLGAWANCNSAQRILDVGSGCGLIALMLAQRTAVNNCEVVGIELNPNAAQQAKTNVDDSPWKKRVTIQCGEFQAFPTTELGQTKFDLIVSNPPFFAKNQPLGNPRSLARQTLSLSKKVLFDVASGLLSDQGITCVIYPFDQRDKTIEVAADLGLYPVRETHVRPLPGQPFKRVLIEFKRDKPTSIQTSELTIESVHHQYTAEFEALTSDFYLRFA